MLVGDRSKSRPPLAGDHMFFSVPKRVAPAEPCTISRHARGVIGFVAWAMRIGVMAGTMDSGTAVRRCTIPRSTVRRDMCFFVMVFVLLILVGRRFGGLRFRLAHLKCWTLTCRTSSENRF